MQTVLQADVKYSVVTNDWFFLGNLMAYETAARHPDLFNAVTVFNDPFGSPDWDGSTEYGYADKYGNSIPLPAGPVNVLIIAGLNSSEQSICGGSGSHPAMGTTYNRPHTVDDTIAYWNGVNRPTTFLYQPNTATKSATCGAWYECGDSVVAICSYEHRDRSYHRGVETVVQPWDAILLVRA